MGVGVRCFQCKEELRGTGTGQQHATQTHHNWQPAYYCTICQALFSKYSECEKHVQQMPGHGKISPPKSSTAPIHVPPSSSSSNHSSPMVAGRVPIGVTASTQGMSRSSVSEPASRHGSSTVTVHWCTQCQPPVTFTSREALNNHSKGMSTCAKCHVHFHGRDKLLDHYRVAPSSVHPKCPDCGTGLLGDSGQEAHKLRCPRAAARTLALFFDSDAESAQSKVTSQSDLVEGSTTVTPALSTGDPSRDVSNMTTMLLGPSGLGSNFASSLTPSPIVTVRHDVDDTEANVLGVTCTQEPPPSLEPSDASISEVDGVLPRVDMYHQGEDEASTNDELLTPTMTSATLEGERRIGTEPVSLHCRACLTNPCVKPVATLCGHIFCHSCIVRQLATTMCCSVCQRPSLIRLHMETNR